MLRSLAQSGLLSVLGKAASIVRVERMGEEARASEPFESLFQSLHLLRAALESRVRLKPRSF